MTSPADVPVPYADPDPLPDLIDECRCVEAECAAHGVNLHPAPHLDAAAPHAGPVVIAEATQHLVDGYSDYGG